MKNISSLKIVAYWAKNNKSVVKVSDSCFDTECSTECTATGCSIAGCGCGVECTGIACSPANAMKTLRQKTR
jgi:hypothetical protein